jgi:hypothetical protein
LKTTLTSILLLLTIFTTQAHVGSAGVVFEGQAGKYVLQVYVQPPDVIPGTAKVTVLADGTDITHVGISPIYFWFGDEGTPRSDEALPIKGEINRFEGQIWLMNSGATSVQVEIEGARGKGKLIVPVSATSTARRTMPAGLGWILAALGLFLIGVLTTIFGASVSDSLQPVGEKANHKTIRKRITGSVVGASFCGLFLFIGNNWWNNETEDYKRNMFQPYTATTKIVDGNTLKLTIDSNSVNERWTSYIIPDHGKLMHLFLVKQGSMDAFAHLHPVRIDTLNYEATLPNLPTGKYLVFADIMRYNGFQYTITDSVEIKSPLKNGVHTIRFVDDLDDTYVITNAINEKKTNTPDQNITICGTPGVRTKLQDGSSIVWEEKPNKPLLAGEVYDLKFSVLSPDGKMADLQPYLGMMGHAAIIKNDGSTYIHLHPTGTVSSTAVTVMEKRIGETTPTPVLLPTKVFKDSVDKVMAKIQTMSEADRDKFLMPNMKHQINQKGHHGNMVSFPYVFPAAGDYRIWLQIKRNGKVLTGAFEAKVL